MNHARNAESRRDLSICFESLGDLCKAQGRLTESQQYYEQALQTDEQPAEETGTVQSQSDLSTGYTDLGDICMAQGRLTETQQYYEQALQVCEQLTKEIGTAEAYDDLAVMHYSLGCTAQSTDGQRTHFSAALRIWEQIAAQCPDVPEYAENRDLAKQALEQL